MHLGKVRKMMKWGVLPIAILLMSGLAACGGNNVGDRHINDRKSTEMEHSTGAGPEKEHVKDKEQVNEPNSEDKKVKEEQSENQSTSVENEQKQMAIDTLKGLVENAKD